MKKVIFLGMLLNLSFQAFGGAVPKLEIVKQDISKASRADIRQVVSDKEACFELLEEALNKVESIPRKKFKIIVNQAKKHDKKRLEDILRYLSYNRIL